MWLQVSFWPQCREMCQSTTLLTNVPLNGRYNVALFFFLDQVMGKVPTISINKTDGCHVYLSKDSLSCEIVSAKSSEMNVLVPNKDGEFVSTVSG